MTNTDATGGGSEPRAPKTKKATATQSAIAPTAPPPTVVSRPGIGRGILIGAVAAAPVGGLAIGGGAGALIATAVDRPHGSNQADQQGPHGPVQQGGQQGAQQQGGQPGQPGGMPGQPPQGGGQQGDGQQGEPPVPEAPAE